ncbi:uncharacterized protein LOC143850044 [Tasmannia lanceolata]|uniref:uncharacterized protein LOC143850044 n=1 Tax=Tasmannia lanceolata TaxID=3420 RepID=UPI004064137C
MNQANHQGKNQSATGLRIAFNASIYQIWTERNRRIHEQKFQHKKSVLNEILLIIISRCIHLGLNDLPSSRAYSLCQNLQLPLFVNVIGPKYCHWSPPETGWCKLNSDAALVGDLATIGGLLRDNSGEPLIAFSINTAAATIQQLEIDAIFYGIKLAREKNITNLWIESDSLRAVNTIRGLIPCIWKKKHILHQIKSELGSF